MAVDRILTGKERTFAPDEIIVSKTDTRGRITYANDVFLAISGYQEKELLDQPHSIIRHPEMPRSVFKLLWDTIEAGNEIFAYVVNRSKSGDHYWVFAHVTPNVDTNGRIIGYHSSRRVARPKALAVIQPLYRKILEEERRHVDAKAGLAASYALLLDSVRRAGFDRYDRFVLSL
jgi:PAS domain S-box-containing protein